MATPMSAMVRLGRLAAGLFSLTLTLGLLVGAPVGLITQIGWPLPRSLPTTPQEVLPQLQQWLTTPVTDEVVLKLLAVAMWILWGSFTISFIAEIPARANGVAARRLPGLGGMHAVSGWLISGITAGILAATTIAAPATAPHAADPTPAVTLMLPDGGQSDTPMPAAGQAHQHADGYSGSPGPITVQTTEDSQPQLVHEVAQGDWMWHIAGRYLGDEERYPEIATLNPQYAQRYDDYPDHIEPGDTLVLPDDARDRGQRPHATGDLAAPTAPAPGLEPAPAQEPADPAPAPPGPPVTPPSPAPDPATPPAPSPTASPSATPSPPAPGRGPAEQPEAGQPDDPAPDDEQPDTGVVLPTGAWVSFGLAALIATAALLLRLHRRRRARLHTRPVPTSLAPAEPPPLPESLRPVEDAGLRVLDFYRTDTTMPGLLPTPAATPAAVGVTAAGEQMSLFDLPGNLLALHGAGAASAVRAVLAAALGTGVTEHTGVQPRVVIPVDLLAGLLPEGTPAVGLDPDGDTFDGERLQVVADEAAAVTRWEEEMFHRRRMCDQHDADTVGELVARDEHPEHLPHFVLFAPAASRYLPRLRAVAVHRRSLLLHTVLSGQSPGGDPPGWHIDPDGTTTTTGGAFHDADETVDAGSSGSSVVRLSTLTAEELAAVLEVVRQVAPRSEPGHDDTEPAAPAEPAALEPTAEAPVVVPAPSGDDPPPVRLRLLGAPQLATDRGPITEGVRSGSVAVMTLLAAHPGGLGLDQIATTLHPGVERPLARGRVHTDIDAARSLLRQATAATGRFVVYDPKPRRYQLDPDLVEVDLWRMLTCIETANRAGDDEATLAALRQATELYSGDFAAGFEQAWAVEHATTIRHTVTQAWARIAEVLEVEAPDEAVAALESAIVLEPVNEELYRRLMRIHGRTGNPDQVRATLKLLERRLAELGDSEPSQATRRVADRQLSAPPAGHTPAAASVGSATTQTAAGTGHHMLRDEPMVNR